MSTQIKTSPLTHLTLNTGHIARTANLTPLDELAAVRPLLARGGPIPSRPPYRVERTRDAGCASFSVWCGAMPVTLNVLVWEEAAAPATWSVIERVYLSCSDRNPAAIAASACPEQPVGTPWLATMLLPGMAFLRHPMEMRWIGAFERIYAEALLAEAAA